MSNEWQIVLLFVALVGIPMTAIWLSYRKPKKALHSFSNGVLE